MPTYVYKDELTFQAEQVTYGAGPFPVGVTKSASGPNGEDPYYVLRTENGLVPMDDGDWVIYDNNVPGALKRFRVTNAEFLATWEELV